MEKLFDAMIDAVACYERDGTVVYVNVPARERFGEALPSDPLLRAAIERVDRTGETEQVDTFSPETNRWHIDHVYLEQDLIWIIGRDVTRERQAVAQLETLATASSVFSEAALDYKTAFERIASHVAEVARDFCVIRLVSPDRKFFEAPVGVWDIDEKVREVLLQVQRVRSEDAIGPELLQTMRPMVIGKLEPHAMAQKIAPPSHREIVEQIGIHSVMVVPMRARGEVVGLMSVGRRTTGTGATYSDGDLRLVEELANRAALVVAQWRAFQRFDAAIVARDDLMSIAAHELRTPLTALGLQLEDLRRSLEREAASDKVRRKLERVTRQSTRLTGLVEVLLDVTRIATGRLELELGEVDLATTIREVVERFESQAAEEGTTLELHVPDSVVGRWDRMRMDQVVTNLVSNALKYGMGQPVAIQLGGDDDWVQLEVRDRGIGIAPEDLDRIFERFERAVPSKHYGGLGLGLYITARIVKRHGGTITVDSTPGAGTCFTVRFPRIASTQARDADVVR